MYHNAVCPGGEGAALKAVDLKGFAGSSPVDGANDFGHRQLVPSDVNKREFGVAISKSTHSV